MRRLAFVASLAAVAGLSVSCHSAPAPSSRQGPDAVGNAPAVPRGDAVARAEQSKPEPYTSLDHVYKVAGSKIPSAMRLVVMDTTDYNQVWTRIVGRDDRSARPKVDFTREMLLVVGMGEHPCLGYAISIDTVYRDQEKRIYALVRERHRGARCGCLADVISPVDVVKVPRTERPVSFLERVETNTCEER
ncbi:MAG: protease complex subunit PrcB family protein [bacterium]